MWVVHTGFAELTTENFSCCRKRDAGIRFQKTIYLNIANFRTNINFRRHIKR